MSFRFNREMSANDRILTGARGEFGRNSVPGLARRRQGSDLREFRSEIEQVFDFLSHPSGTLVAWMGSRRLMLWSGTSPS
jgi:hypothetical protein